MKYILHTILFFFLLPITTTAQQFGKMSSFVRNISIEQHLRKASAKDAVPDSRFLTALVQCTDASVLNDNGCRVLASFDDDIHIVAIPLSRLNALAASKSVMRIEANERCSICNDTTRTILNTSEALRAAASQRSMGIISKHTGERVGEIPADVIVGVMDIGFDLTHPTLFDHSGSNYRVRRFWDMLDADSIGSDLYVGRDYRSEEDILRKRSASDGTFETHGTHTSGTAAGSGSEGNGSLSPYSLWQHEEGSTEGIVLPDIVLVANATSNNTKLIPEHLRYKYTTATDLLGFKYIFDYANEVGKPCVVNFSEGSRDDFYENILHYNVLSQLTGPGRIIVSSAGNEGKRLSYLACPPDKQSVSSLYYSNTPSACIVFRSSDVIRFDATFDCMSIAPVTYHFSSEGMVIDSLYTDTITVNDVSYLVSKAVYYNCFDPEHLAGELYLQDLSHVSFGSGQQRVSFSVSNDTSTELFYLTGEFLNRSERPSDALPTHNILFPSSSPSVICVGNNGYRPGIFNYHGEWKAGSCSDGNINPYSSHGPSISGETKPNVIAPGTLTVSAFSSVFFENNPESSEDQWNVRHFQHNDRTYGWTLSSGTSMSSPVAVAVIAMWLQVCPTLTVDQINETFRAVCPTLWDGATDVPSFGPYNGGSAYAGLNFIIENFLTGIKSVSVSRPSSPYVYNMVGQRVSSRPSRGIYIVNGRKVVN